MWIQNFQNAIMIIKKKKQQANKWMKKENNKILRLSLVY